MNFLDILDQLDVQNSYLFILRHAEKAEISQSGSDAQLEITQNGVTEAKALGRAILDKCGKFSQIKSSPLTRCVQTTNALLAGNLSSLAVNKSTLLGDPGAFVENGDIACVNFNEGVCKAVEKQHQAHASSVTLPGMRSMEEGTRLLLQEITADIDNAAGLNVYVTHDAILTVFVGYLIDKQFRKDDWINYLEGVAIRKDQQNNYYLYWDREYDITAKLQHLGVLQSANPLPTISR